MIDLTPRITPPAPVSERFGKTVTCPRCERRITRGFAHNCFPVLRDARAARRAYILGLVRIR